MCFVVTSTWKDRTWPSPPQICIFYDVLHLYVHLGTFLSVTLCTYCYIRVLFIVHLSITTQSVRQKKSSRGIQGKSQHHAQQRNESKQRTTILLVPPSPPPPRLCLAFLYLLKCVSRREPHPPPPPSAPVVPACADGQHCLGAARCGGTAGHAAG
jgi:hypothetical protein